MEYETNIIENAYIIIDEDKIFQFGIMTLEIELDIMKGNYAIINTIENNHIKIINGVLMPGFVKTHGHDETILIGLNKEDILTEWLDNVVNPFSKFLK